MSRFERDHQQRIEKRQIVMQWLEQRPSKSKLGSSTTRLVNRMLVFFSLVTLMAQSYGIDKAEAQGRSSPALASAESNQTKDSDKLDVTDLEKKYWSSKDTDFSVVQNRLFSKEGRFALTANYGGFVNDAWSEGPSMGVGLNYFLSERYGLELSFLRSNSQDSKATESLKTNQDGAPNHGKIKSFYGAAFSWVPFYAKMSVMDATIVYFDMAVSFGAGVTEYEQQLEEGPSLKSAPSVTLDISQHFFLNKWFALRFDYKNRWFQEEVTQYRSPVVGQRTTVTETNQTSFLMFGATVYF
jgi:outer membrane beta-barrel protein